MGRRHNDRLREELARVRRDPFSRVVAAADTDAAPDPEAINGHVPDLVTEDVTGAREIVEVEAFGDQSRHTRQQRDAFGAAAESDPLTEFETVFYGEDDDSGLFDF